MAEIVRERDGLHQILVQPEAAGDGASDLRDFQGVGEAGAVVVAFGVDENLGFVLQAAERFRVQDTVAVAHELGAERVERLGAQAASGLGGLLGVRGEELRFEGFGSEAETI